MHYRFTATKENIELNLIKFLQENGRSLVIKKEDDYKGISFSFVWERYSETNFKLICYYKGIFSIVAEEFKELISTQPFGVVNSALIKELLSVTYMSDSSLKLKDIVYTDPIKFKFTELFETEEVMLHYIAQIFRKFGWQLQIRKEDSLEWQNYLD